MTRSRDPVGKAFLVLSWMADHVDTTWTTREIAKGTGLALTTTHRVVSSFERSSIVARVDGRYALGLEMERIGHRIAAGSGVQVVAKRHLQSLVGACDEQAYLVLFDRQRALMMFGLTVEASHPLRYTIEQYRWEPLHGGASCLAVISFLPEDELDELIRGHHLNQALHDLGDEEKLREEMANVRSRGYAITYGRHTAGAVGIAAPVLDRQSSVIADVLVTVPEHRSEPAKERDIALVTMSCADAISRQLGSLQTNAAGNDRDAAEGSG